MNINKWLWGGLGWAVGGPIGAIMGYALGSMSSTNQNFTQTRGGDFGATMLILFASRRANFISTYTFCFCDES